MTGSASEDVTRERLRRLVRERSWREGDFTLSSGKKSSFYIDLKSSTLHPEGAMLIGALAVREARASGVAVDAVGGLTLGADPIATATSLAAREVGLFWPAFIVRKEPKGHGTGRYIEGTENLPPRAKCLVLEDVVTTGASSLKAIERLREAGYEPTSVLTVVDRNEGGREAIEREGLRFLKLLDLADLVQA